MCLDAASCCKILGAQSGIFVPARWSASSTSPSTAEDRFVGGGPVFWDKLFGIGVADDLHHVVEDNY
jgi:hypothetical protein